MQQRSVLLRLAQAVTDFCAAEDDVRVLLHRSMPKTSAFDLAYVAGRPLLVCNISSGNKVKDWPVKRYAELFALLCNERGLAVLLLGTAEHTADAAIAMAGCQEGSIASALGKTSLPEVMHLLGQASVFLGNDSGLTHLAARMGVPTIALFSGVAEIEQWAPDGPDVSILHVPLSCSGCRITRIRDCQANQACLNNISVDGVAAVIEHRLAELKAVTSQPRH
jgi:ADP-heptose:LPS heptosyltransferase